MLKQHLRPTWGEARNLAENDNKNKNPALILGKTAYKGSVIKITDITPIEEGIYKVEYLLN